MLRVLVYVSRFRARPRLRLPYNFADFAMIICRWCLFTLALIILCLPLQAKENITGWNVREPEIRDILVAGSFANDQVGWVCGIQTMLRTSDSGKTWFQQLPEEGGTLPYGFTSVQALSTSVAMASAAGFGSVTSGALLRTEDGGANWSRLAMRDGIFTSLKFRDNKRTGYLISSTDGLMKTVDGGIAWLPIRTPLSPTSFKKSTQDLISLPDERTIWLSGEKSLMVSHDDGDTWSTVKLPLGTRGQVFHMSFATASHGWVTMLEGDTMETRDAGKTWKVSDTGGQFYALTPNLIWMLSNTNALRSDDGGRTWTRDLQVDHRRGRLISIVHTDSRLYLLGGAQGRNQPFLADRGIDIEQDVAGPQGQVPIAFVMPTKGHATVQVVDSKNQVVNNLVSGAPFAAGGNRVLWDLTTVDDYWGKHEKLSGHLYEPAPRQPKLVEQGQYRWRGLNHRGIVPQYHYSFLPAKSHGMPWLSPDGTGGWVGDMEPAATIVRGSNGMWIGAYAKKGDALIQCAPDTRKLWGTGRTQLACPTVLAQDGPYVYFVDEGDASGNGLVLVQVDTASKVSRRIVVLNPRGSARYDITGLAVSEHRVYIANRASNEILVGYLDRTLTEGVSDTGSRVREHVSDDIMKRFPVHAANDGSLVIINSIPLNRPGRIRSYNDTHLAAVGGGGVSLIDKKLYSVYQAVQGLSNPLGLEVDREGNFYVGEMAPQHQVKVFDRDGRQLRTIGLVGPHRIGRFNPNNLESPAGIAIDQTGMLWVCEANKELRRVSIWNSEGQCVRQVIGPAVYGGGGALDPRDMNRFFYQGKEFRRDPASGKVSLTHILWRQQGIDYDRFSEPNTYSIGNVGPAYPFYSEDRLFFSRADSYGNGGTNTVWVHADDHLRPVAAMGATPAWLNKRFGGPGHSTFAWTDRNSDGKVQRGEAQTSTMPAGGSVWGSRMSSSFEVGFSSQNGQAGVAFFRATQATSLGYPVYKLPTEFTPLHGVQYTPQNQIQSVITDSMGRAIVCGPYIASINPDGGTNWRYENRWPGLSGGLFTTATGADPGLLIGSTRFLGSADLGHAIGEIIFLANNFGSIDMLTSDGLYVGRVFHDLRRGNRWTSDAVPSSRTLSSFSLGQEHFGGSIQQVRGSDGRPRVFLVASGAGGTCSIIELLGLDTIRRFKGENLAVFSDQAARAKEQLARRRVLTRTARHYNVPVLQPKIDGNLNDWPAGDAHGIRLAYDDNHLYVAYTRNFGRPKFANSSTPDDYLECFKHGDVIDIQLGTSSDLKDNRVEPSVGDMRLCITRIGEEYQVVLYDFARQRASREEHVHFQSPWRSTVCNHVEILENARVSAMNADRFQLEAAIPLADIGLNPKVRPRIRGDLGVGLSDQTGTRTVERVFWSNPYSNLYSDLPSEALVYPAYWGTFHFVGATK
ncbi:MAG: photosystem II stability/assembly factor-like uncharacterized protein [Rhodothermales bacterium]